MIRRLLFFPFAVLSTFFFSSVAVVGGLVRAPKPLFDWVHRNWSRSILSVAGVTVRIGGREHIRPDAAQVFVSNHQSGFDIWALMATLPASIRFVTKQELGRIPIFAAACRAAGHVFIDRSKPAEAGERIRQAGERMRREGLSLVLFPEGTRSRGGRLGRFKKGSFALAIETQVHLVPVAVDGGAKILGSRPRRLVPGPIEVRCAPPIAMRGLGADDRDALLERTEKMIREMLAAIRGRGIAGEGPVDLLEPDAEPTIREVEPGDR